MLGKEHTRLSIFMAAAIALCSYTSLNAQKISPDTQTTHVHMPGQTLWKKPLNTFTQKAVALLKIDARKNGLGYLAQHTLFIDAANPSSAGRVAIVKAYRHRFPGITSSDSQIMDDANSQIAQFIPGSNVVTYNSKVMKEDGFDSRMVETILAHELTHEKKERQHDVSGPPEVQEQVADMGSAIIVSPKDAVRTLKRYAENDPVSNYIILDKKNSCKESRDLILNLCNHKSDYERAVAIREAFPDAKIDLSDFPRPQLISMGVLSRALQPRPATVPLSLTLPGGLPVNPSFPSRSP